MTGEGSLTFIRQHFGQRVLCGRQPIDADGRTR